MIALDTSAIMAILLDEPDAETCIAAIERAEEIVMSAGTLAETLIVADRRGIGPEARRLLAGLAPEVALVTPAGSERIAAAYARWGKGVHAAGLNFGDCFAYDVAKEQACPLSFVGQDFARTDVESAL